MRPFLIRHHRRVMICGSCLLTLATIELIVRSGAPVLRAYDEATYQKTLDALDASGRPDIVILGSSRAGYALDPAVVERITGRRAFNAYIPATKVVEWNVLARRMFTNHKPRLVILGINASEVRADYTPTEAARHAFNWNDFVESIRVDGFSLDVAGAYARRALSPLWATYQFRYELSLWAGEQFDTLLPTQAQIAREHRERALRPFPENGYRHPWLFGRQRMNLTQRLLAAGLSRQFATCPRFDPNCATFERFEQLLDHFRAEEIRVVVAYVPNSPGTEQRWIDTEPLLTERIAGVCSAKDVPFLHWNVNDLPRTDDDYIHETHVGLSLGRQITARIAHYIQSHALLDAPHGANDRRLASTEIEP